MFPKKKIQLIQSSLWPVIANIYMSKELYYVEDYVIRVYVRRRISSSFHVFVLETSDLRDPNYLVGALLRYSLRYRSLIKV